jgi:MSHA biogenesis protein MshO
MMRRCYTMRARGFTLIEAVMAIVLVGILGAIVATFIRVPVQGYVDSVERADLTDTADLTLRRMARDIRLALPNSVRITSDSHGIEFIPTKLGGRYLAAEDGVVSTVQVLDFSAASKTTLTVAGPALALSTDPSPVGKNGIVLGADYLVVSNLGPGFAPADAYQLNAPPPEGINIAKITAATGTDWPSVTIASNVFASQLPPMPSPMARFQVVGQPVTYFCAPAADGSWTLYRKWNYGFNAAQDDPTVSIASDPSVLGVPQQRVLANRLAPNGCTFHYSALLQRSALVILTIELLPRSVGKNVRLVHQIHVDNTP